MFRDEHRQLEFGGAAVECPTHKEGRAEGRTDVPGRCRVRTCQSKLGTAAVGQSRLPQPVVTPSVCGEAGSRPGMWEATTTTHCIKRAQRRCQFWIDFPAPPGKTQRNGHRRPFPHSFPSPSRHTTPALCQPSKTRQHIPRDGCDSVKPPFSYNTIMGLTCPAPARLSSPSL